MIIDATVPIGASAVLALSTAFVGGVVSAFNPCCIPMLPTVVALVSNHSRLNKVRGAIIASCFVIGFAATTAIMGALSASLGMVFGHFGKSVSYLVAAVPFVMAFHLYGIIRIRLPILVAQGPTFEGHLGAMTTGAAYALVIVPCATPILASILAYAAYRESIAYGSGLLFIYGIGAGIPLIVMGSFMGLLGALRSFERHKKAINYVTATTLVGVGLYLIWLA